VLYLQKEIIQQESTRSSLSTILPSIDVWRAISWQVLTSHRPGMNQVIIIGHYTINNDLTRRVTNREAVFGMVMHFIFDGWHYGVLWACMLTRLLWYTCDYVCLILYIMLHPTYNQTVKCTSLHAPKYSLKYTTDCARLYTPSLLDLHSEVSSQDTLKYTPSTPPSTLPGILSRTLPIALDDTLPACLTILSQVSSQDSPMYTCKYVLKYTPELALQDAPNCTRWHTPCLLDCTLPSILSRCSQNALKHTPKHAPKCTLKRHNTPNLTWLYTPMYAPGCSIERLAEM